MSDLQRYLDDIGELRCAPLLNLLATQIADFGPDVESHIGSFGVRFTVTGATLCELSVFGELFIARIGPGQSLEYRVRDEGVALRALDHILREYVLLRTTPSTSTCNP